MEKGITASVVDNDIDAIIRDTIIARIVAASAKRHDIKTGHAPIGRICAKCATGEFYVERIIFAPYARDIELVGQFRTLGGREYRVENPVMLSDISDNSRALKALSRILEGIIPDAGNLPLTADAFTVMRRFF